MNEADTRLNQQPNGLNQSFRDTVGTIDKKGRRTFIYPKKPAGPLYQKRTIASLIYLAIFFTLPFIRKNGEPLFMANVLKRKFILFGQIFGPDDFFIFVLGMLAFMVFIIVFTVVFGRVFCGWACPQTIFMEMVFRKLEYWIDGDAQRQRQLKQMPWNAMKIRKRVLKILVFFLISFIIAHFFLAYLIGMDEVLRYISSGVTDHVGQLASLIGFTLVFFFVFYWFREQVCIVVCPYGRLQGVLLDRKSIVVAYDYVRGEPRSKINKSSAANNAGDCVDCAACVRVCPTGIDIRNGTQLECVNCTACIDACDEIMEAVKKPTGLIRYASEANIASKEKTGITPRLLAYSLVLVLLLSSLGFMLMSRDDMNFTLLRASGSLYQELQDNQIGNLYNLRISNKTRQDISLQLAVLQPEGEIKVVGDSIHIKPEAYQQATILVKLKTASLKQRKTSLRIGVYRNKQLVKTLESTFIGPVR